MFISRGKTNWKFIAIVIVLATVVGGGVFVWQSKLQGDEDIKNQGVISSQELTLSAIKNADFYVAAYDEKVQLANGQYLREPQNMEPGSFEETGTYLNVTIVSNGIAFGDLNSDGKKDAAVILTANGGGSGSFRELAVMVNQNGKPIYADSIPLGDRTIINSISIDSGIITVDMVGAGAEDPACCPTKHGIYSFRLLDQMLLEEIAGWQIKPIDRFSFNIYDGENLIKTVSRNEIVSEFKNKYQEYDEGIDSVVVARFYNDPIEFVFDAINQRIIIPIAPARVAGSVYGWDFYIFSMKTKAFYIMPGERPPDPNYNFPTASILPSEFTISPDKKNLAYRFGYAGGTCVLQEYPQVMDLNTFKSVDIGDTWKKTKEALIKESGVVALPEGYSFTYAVSGLSWISNNKLKAAMTFGGLCPLWFQNVPDEIKAEVEFTVSP